MNRCNIPIIVLPGTSSPADIKRAIDTSNQTVEKSDGKRNKCKSRKSFADFNLASLPYRVLFIFGVIVVLLQNNTTSSSLGVSRNGRSLGEHYHDDPYDDRHDKDKRNIIINPAAPIEPDDDRHDKPHDDRHDKPHDDRHDKPHDDPFDDRHDKPHDDPFDDRHDKPHDDPFDDRHDKDKRNIIINPAAPIEPDDDRHDKPHDDRHDKPHDDPFDDRHDKPHDDPFDDRHDKDDKHTIHNMKPEPAYDDEKDDKSNVINDDTPSPAKPDDDPHHDGSHPRQRGRRVGVTGAMPQGPGRRSDRRGDKRELRNDDERRRAVDGRRGRGGYDDYNGPDGFESYYNRRFGRGDDDREIKYDESKEEFDEEFHGKEGDERTIHYARTHRMIDDDIPHPPNGRMRRGDDDREIKYDESKEEFDEEFHGKEGDERTIHYARTHRMIDDDIPHPPNRRLKRGDDGREIKYAETHRAYDEESHGKEGDDRTIHYSETSRMIDDDIPHPPNRRLKRGDDGREIHYAETRRAYDDEFHGKEGDDRTFHYSETSRMIDDDIPHPPNRRLKRGDDGREIKYAETHRAYDEESHGKEGDDRTIHYSETRRMIDDDIPHPPNRRFKRGDDGREIHYAETRRAYDDESHGKGGDDRTIHYSETSRIIDDDIPHPPNRRLKRGDDGREIHYAETRRAYDDESHGKEGDDRTFHYSETSRMIDDDIPHPPNRRLKRGDGRSADYDRFNSMRYEGDFNQGRRGGRMRNANPFSVPGGRKDDDRTFRRADANRMIDDVNDPRKPHDSRSPNRKPEDDPRQIHNSRENPMKPDDKFFDEERFGRHGGPGKLPDGRNRPPMSVGSQGDQGRRDKRGRDGRLDMEGDRFNSRADFMRRSPDERGRQGGRDMYGRPHGDDERLPFGCTRAELEEQMTEEELNSKIKNLRPNATVKEMFVLFNQILSLERKKFVKTQEYIMQYSHYLQKTLALPTPIRMKYWWRAHYNMTDELIKKERGDFQDFYAFVNKGPCQKWDFLYFANAKRKSWDELRDLMKSVWMEILTYKMKKHSKL
ncbi:PHIST81 [Plasmodium coatneyi]|uniref:PHIST81 n=1 Tax=Plasmodium coatneyi TaxID=208452 RepID=A0A1B1DSF8_9APIC|nr:PHIST81 [Plasmodium coatneyi]ANQ05713.1 PHIST81 [Plasmodium coatneyi]